ncbi:MAG: IS110 family transposase, partial [Solirubrobacterales bacterium]|nr:IS110 family transposase [Solirubrobacterales bacterium]
MGNYAGVDWASDKHDVLVADEAGEKLFAATFAHEEKGLRALCRTLVRLGVVLVAIERPDGLLVERLLDAGLRVLALHPNKVAAARDRFRVSGGKSDRFDAFVLCELARTDHHRFRVLEPDCDATKAIRASTRARADLVAARTAVVNQLRSELERFWPGPLGLFSHMDSEILLAFLERYPSPADARGLGVARMQAFLERERYSGRQHPSALIAKLRSAPQGRVGELELATRRQLVLAFVATVRTLNAQIKGLERQISSAIRAHPEGHIFLSLFKQPTSRGAARGDRRLPCALPHPRHTRRRRRAGGRRQGIRQTQDRLLPLGVQQAPTRRVLPPGGQQPPLAPLGARPLHPGPPARPRAPPRDTHSRTRLVPCRVAML